MTTKGIRISDKDNGVLTVSLKDILNEIRNGKSFYWFLLFFDGQGHLGEGKSIPAFMEKTNHSKDGLFLSWEELNLITQKFEQVFEILLIGCLDKRFLHRYKEDRTMCQACDVVIEMIHCNFWEIFSKDLGLIERLSTKFRDTKFLEPDCKK